MVVESYNINDIIKEKIGFIILLLICFVVCIVPINLIFDYIYGSSSMYIVNNLSIAEGTTADIDIIMTIMAISVSIIVTIAFIYILQHKNLMDLYKKIINGYLLVVIFILLFFFFGGLFIGIHTLFRVYINENSLIIINSILSMVMLLLIVKYYKKGKNKVFNYMVCFLSSLFGVIFVYFTSLYLAIAFLIAYSLFDIYTVNFGAIHKLEEKIENNDKDVVEFSEYIDKLFFNTDNFGIGMGDISFYNSLFTCGVVLSLLHNDVTILFVGMIFFVVGTMLNVYFILKSNRGIAGLPFPILTSIIPMIILSLI